MENVPYITQYREDYEEGDTLVAGAIHVINISDNNAYLYGQANIIRVENPTAQELRVFKNQDTAQEILVVPANEYRETEVEDDIWVNSLGIKNNGGVALAADFIVKFRRTVPRDAINSYKAR